MKKLLALLIIGSMFLFAGNAMAVPAIDGSLASGEWAGAIVNAWDPDETSSVPGYDLPATHDINWVRLYVETAGAGSGMYGLVDLYGSPTWTSLGDTEDLVSYTVYFDLNRNGSLNDLVDRRLRYQQSGAALYYGSGGIVTDAGLQAVMGTSNDPVVEFFIPSAMLWSAYSDFNGEVLLQNGGRPLDDALPDTGRFSSTPEPGSMALVGMGLLGFCGMLRRKFMA